MESVQRVTLQPREVRLGRECLAVPTFELRLHKRSDDCSEYDFAGNLLHTFRYSNRCHLIAREHLNEIQFAGVVEAAAGDIWRCE